MMMRLALAALALVGSLVLTRADGLNPAGTAAQGLCYAAGTNGPRVPCVLQGQTWTRVMRPTDPADGLTATAPGATASRDMRSWLGATHFNVSSIPALRAWPVAPLVAGAVVRTSGYYAAGDDGGAIYTWAPASTAADDGCAAIRPTGATGAGRWLRTTRGAVLSVKSCGAVGDSLADDTAAIQATIAYAESTSAPTNYWTRVAAGGVYLNPGQYLVSGIDTYLPIRVYGDGPGSVTITLKAGSNRSVIRSFATPQSDGSAKNLQGQGVFENFSIDGNKGNNTAGHGIEFVDAPYSISNQYALAGIVRNVNSYAAKEDGFYVGINRNLFRLDGSNSTYNGKYGVFLNASYDHRISTSAIGANESSGLALYLAGATHVNNTDIFNNGGAGLLLNEFGSVFTMQGGSIGANKLEGIIATRAATSETAAALFSGVMLADNSQDGGGNHPHVRAINSRLSFVGTSWHRGDDATTKVPSYVFDIDANSFVSDVGSTYSRTSKPFTTAYTNRPARINSGTNTEWVDFTPAWSGVTNGSVGASSGQYRLVDGTLDMVIDTTFAFTGTPPANLILTLPAGFIARATAPIFGGDYTTSRGQVQAQFVAGNAFAGVVRYDNTAPAQNNTRLVFSGRIEVQ